MSQHHQESEDHQEENSNHHEGPMIVMFIFFGLLLGGLLRQINKTTKIPYTPMLLITGVFLGYARQYLGVVGEATTLIETINPHMILMIFIPVLIFESAFNCDWYVFRKSLLNIILLAGPGVLWGAILIAICFKTILFYHELSWYEVLTLGCVLSATDPVAVVALLKELGASVRFNTLVEGESLMNDGTAMVFFMLFIDLVKGNSSSASSVVFNFIRIAFGGPLLGLIIGIITSFWMKKIIRDPVLSTNITFVGAFICFYIAQFTWVRVSGILSIVVFGLYMSAVGRRRIYSESQHALHNVWGYIQYACQTLIFLLTGIVVGVQMIRQSTITIMDWVRMLLFWFLMIGLRSLMVLTLYPCLKSNGYGLSKKQLVVLIYGGLRGALGLCLSLLVGVDDSLPQRFRQITVFYMCGMAMLTIVVNGLTCGKVVNYLEMISYPEIKRKLLKRCVKDVLSNTQNKLKQLKVDPNIAYANWKEVQQLAQVKQLGSIFHERHSIESNIRDSLREIRKSQMIEEIRFRFTRYLNKVYWELYQHGQLSEDTIKILSESCDIANDEVSNRLRYFSILSSNFTPETMKVYIYFKDYAFIGGYITRLLVQKIYFIYEVSTAFLQACQETLHTFENSFPLNTDHLKYVTQQVHESMQQAVAYINEIQNNYPTIIQKVHTTRAALILLKSKKHRLKQMHEQGFIDHEDYNQLRKCIDKGIIIAQYNDFKLQQIKFNSVFTQCPLFSSLSSQEIVNIRMKSTQKSYDQKTRILNKGIELNCINIIIWGTVREEFEDFSLIRGIGNAINPYDFTFHQNCKCIARASTDIKILQVSGNMIHQLLQKYPEFKKKWYKTLFTYTMRHNKNLQFLQKTFSERQLRRFIEASEVKLLEAGEMLVSEQGSYIYEGQVQCDGSTYSRGNFLSQNKSMQALTKAIILKFVRIVGLQINNDRISVFNQE